MNSTARVRLAVLSVCVLVAGTLGPHLAWRDATVEPPSPRPVCELIRVELLDLLVPGRGPLRAEGEEGSTPGTRSNTCAAQSTSPVEGARAPLWVALIRYGRHEGQGPRCVTQEGSLLTVANRPNHRIPLGDAGIYFFDGPPGTDQPIHLTACLGSYLVYVRCEAVGASEASIVRSATTVGQEVLSRL